MPRILTADFTDNTDISTAASGVRDKIESVTSV